MFLQCVVVLDSCGMHTAVLGAVWEGERCNFTQSSIQKAGKLSFNCSVYFRGLIFFMLKDNNSLRKYKSFLTNSQ